jgi:5-methylthioadenosine/S-adenosylhomocysteine deaminase
VHCVHLTKEDIKILAEKQVGVAHNPNSNAKLASGVAPVPDLIAAGIKVGIGTDGAASNNRLDMFGEMAMATKIHKAVRLDPLAVDAYSAVKMATIDGAKVLGLGDKIGSLEKGKRADIILIDTLKPNMFPMYNVYSHLAYAVNAASVETVIIDGKIIMENQQLLTLDESEIRKEVMKF